MSILKYYWCCFAYLPPVSQLPTEIKCTLLYCISVRNWDMKCRGIISGMNNSLNSIIVETNKFSLNISKITNFVKFFHSLFMLLKSKERKKHIKWQTHTQYTVILKKYIPQKGGGGLSEGYPRHLMLFSKGGRKKKLDFLADMSKRPQSSRSERTLPLRMHVFYELPYISTINSLHSSVGRLSKRRLCQSP